MIIPQLCEIVGKVDDYRGVVHPQTQLWSFVNVFVFTLVRGRA